MSILGVIPARMGSSRFPGKPLARIAGRPMLEHVYRRTLASSLLDEVVIATCDDEIARAAAGFDARTVMTSSVHERAADRVAEVSAGHPAEVIVMIQGDEPMVEPAMIEAVITPMVSDPSRECTNLMAPIDSETELRDRNTVKVVTDASLRALYFSREPIPSRGQAPFAAATWFKQVCVIAFSRQMLLRFGGLPQGPLERLESVDMLRLLEHGIAVQMVPTGARTHAVDTPADLAIVEALLQSAGQLR